ncbi:MAG: aminotransferase class III-fold pyridoxal phosphate-dependent enzyme [Xanthobacteraceae bacterium]
MVAFGNEILGRASIPHTTKIFQEVDIHIVTAAPATAGRHNLLLSLVHEGVTHFQPQGVPPVEIALEVQDGPPQADADLFEIALRSNWAFYHPSGYVSCLSDGTVLPRVLERGEGSHVWDSSGRRYIDYTMGWGCALLGHGHKEIEASVRRWMGCGPTLPLPHRIELELTDALCQQAKIPCAEAAAFGKNGSDVCTLAVRLARLATGRHTILFCGYHGWQDWYAEGLGFGGTGVPERDRQIVHRFSYNDIPSFRHAISEHRADLAAVMLEPSGASGGVDGIGEDTDLAFLNVVAEDTRAAGGLLIFDEIITGFRYPGGSVQKATNVIPDLACFGKALGNGFPISALLGRRDLMRLMSRTFYGPTFKGEVYSLAAARSALTIYGSEPVAEHVCLFGQRLRAGLMQICGACGVDARVVGPPFRMRLVFAEPDPLRRKLLHTLYVQQLLGAGLITYQGIMLPSYAHGEAELSHTMSVMEDALGRCAHYSERESIELHRCIEIPLIDLPGS